jgi:cytoskeletal protein CcmA (bactofilin family)
VRGGNITTGGQVSATGNITAANLSVSGVININNQTAATVDDAIALSIALG